MADNRIHFDREMIHFSKSCNKVRIKVLFHNQHTAERHLWTTTHNEKVRKTTEECLKTIDS